MAMTDLDDVRVLSLDRAWIYKVTVLADLVARRVGAAVQSACGLNLSQWRVMAALADDPGCTATVVVQRTPMDKGLVSRAVGTLVTRGIVERRASPDDGRLSHLWLTDEGKRVYEAILEVLAQSGADGLATLPESREGALLSLLDEAIEQYGAPH